MNRTIEDKISDGRQYRDIDLKNIECRDASGDGDEMLVTGYATTFNQPYELFRVENYIVTEEVDPHAYDECDLSDVIMQYNHEGRVFARGSNGTLTVAADEFGLRMMARLDGTELGRQVWNEIRGGYTNKMSQGFMVAKDERTETEDRETGIITINRKILKVSKLFDVSAVSLPANPGTSISVRSYCEGVIAEVKQEIAERAERERKIKRIRIMCEV